MKIIDTLKNVWKITELKDRIILTLGLLLVYRFGAQVVLPGIDATQLGGLQDTTDGGILGLLNAFTGGAFADDDYIWMKDYLQLDGMCYKLVPIKTPVNRANPFDMGRVDSDLMYEKVKKWDWGNSGSPDIYHDVETRKNSITYRGNLARLMEQLINEDKLNEAEEVADIAMTNMPVEYFGFYTLLEPYISGYYEVGNKEKAQQLFKEVANKES